MAFRARVSHSSRVRSQSIGMASGIREKAIRAKLDVFSFGVKGGQLFRYVWVADVGRASTDQMFGGFGVRALFNETPDGVQDVLGQFISCCELGACLGASCRSYRP